MAERKDIWYAVVNPHAGSGKTISLWQKAEIRLRQRRIHYTSAKTEHPKHAVELTELAAAKGYRKFIAIGGDGTVHEVLNGIMRFHESNSDISLEDFTLAVLPIGSGNDWIKAHNVPNDTLKAVDFIAESKFAKQDVVMVMHNNEDGTEDYDYMLNVAGIGFDARVCERVNAQKAMGKKGKLIYLRALLRVLKNFYSFTSKVYVDGELVYEGDTYSMAFGIGPWSGGGMRQVPDAIVDDGLLDVLVIPKISMKYLITQVPKLFTGRLNTVPELIYRKAKKIEVQPGDYFGGLEPVEIDGEVVGTCPTVFTVLPEQINVLSNRK